MKFLRLFLYYLIQWTFGIFQNVIGFFLFLKYRKCRKEWYHGALITYHKENWGGISLGMFVIIKDDMAPEVEKDYKIHEYGHTIQSLILGPLYFPIIAIPSFIWCNAPFARKVWKSEGGNYYSFYPEKTANILGQCVTKEKMNQTEKN